MALNVNQPKSKLGFNATWSMAVGGMVGGGIFSTLGVVVGIAGAWALLTYDYKDIETPQKTLPRAVLSAIVIVTGVYVVVALGTTMLIGADQVVRHKEVALAIAGRRALGTVGLVVVTIAAAFSTGSAINATLFATARLANRVAEDGELPAAMDHKNAAGIPDRAVIVLGSAAAVLAAVGTLTTLVEAASLTFLFTFAVVCGLAFYQGSGARVITG
jgi:amino acid transporter